MRNTRITSSKLLALQIWPAALHLPLIDDFVKDIRCHVWSLQLVTDNTLYFLVGEGDSMLREGKRVHICTQRCLGYHRVRLGKHFCPCVDVCLVDILHNIFKTELCAMTSSQPKDAPHKRTHPNHCTGNKIVIFKRGAKYRSHGLSSLVKCCQVVIGLMKSDSRQLRPTMRVVNSRDETRAR